MTEISKRAPKKSLARKIAKGPKTKKSPENKPPEKERLFLISAPVDLQVQEFSNQEDLVQAIKKLSEAFGMPVPACVPFFKVVKGAVLDAQEPEPQITLQEFNGDRPLE